MVVDGIEWTRQPGSKADEQENSNAGSSPNGVTFFSCGHKALHLPVEHQGALIKIAVRWLPGASGLLLYRSKDSE